MSCEPARRRALEILLKVAEGDRLDPLLEAALRETADSRTGAFMAELVRGTLQWQGRYDHIITRFSRKRPPADPVLVNILRLTLHQMLGLDGVPVYAAIHQAGELCALKAGRRKVGFVNGMLQSIRREVLAEGVERSVREREMRTLFAELEEDRPRWLAAWYSLPHWLVTRWVRNLGLVEAEKLCAWVNEPVALHFHVLGDHPVAQAQAALAEHGLIATAGDGPGTLVMSERPSRARIRQCLAEMPWLLVQDVSVQQATQWLMADLPVAGRWLDLCAAPGGKSAHMQAVLPEHASLVAMDRNRERVELLAGTLTRVAPGRVPLLVADAEHPPFAAGTFDCILLDGPCSGTGVLRHHPEGRWRMRARTPANKARTLLSLAGQASDLLAPGGVLLYATCSLEPEENDGVLKSLLAAHADLAALPDSQGVWRRSWLPHEARGDGFFAARLRKAEQSDHEATGTEN